MLTLLLIAVLITHSELFQDNSPHDNVLPPTLQTSGDFLENHNSPNQEPHPPVPANKYHSSRRPSSSDTVLDGRRPNLQSTMSSVLVEPFDNAVSHNAQPHFHSIETFYDHSNGIIEIVLKGNSVVRGSYTLSLEGSDLTIPSSDVNMEDGTVSFPFPISESDPDTLNYGQTYLVASVSYGDADPTVGNLLFTVEFPSILHDIYVDDTSEMSYSIIINFLGHDFEPGAKYIAEFNNSISVQVTMDSPDHGTSEVIFLGTSDGFMFDATYTLTSLTPVGDAIQIRFYDLRDVTTPRQPTEFLFVLGNTGSPGPSESCGDWSRPCSTIDQAWAIVKRMQIQTVRLFIDSPTKQIAPIEIGRNQKVLLEGVNSKLVLPSSASMGSESGMIVVHDATLDFDYVTVRIEKSELVFISAHGSTVNFDAVELTSTSPSVLFLSTDSSTIFITHSAMICTLSSLVFLSASSSDVTIVICSFLFISSSATNEDDSLCAWDTGVVHLFNSTTEIDSTEFQRLPSGAINMEEGKLTIEASVFTDNGPRHMLFPSARRNIHCSGGGVIEIKSLYGGDGTRDHPSLWISADENVIITSDSLNVAAPLFIPTFNPRTSIAEGDKKSKQYVILISGETLIPCGLFLEVFEVLEDKSEGQSVLVLISDQSTTLFTETKVEMILDSSLLSHLDSANDLRFRLRYGHDQCTESALLSETAKRKLAFDAKRHLAWAIPVAIVGTLAIAGGIVVIILVYRRKTKNKAQTDEEQEKEEEKEVDTTQRE
ncbi:hypothetical protein BLNAU_3831 [Blattamonas nauphoetae]|uniref:Uncharacterized protein n=1 Tax=Blattamonas nauphoetae TaxID=2049346 RepID=A0ABQ9YBB7_9EUKA|nr:hypothetical protein BLNAU_3831 [Blattamonas nauphoetae]